MSASTIPVSLALTTLNEERSIDSFLASVASMTVLPREIVVCDGGSSDATLERLRAARIADVEIIVLSEPGSNIARGRNAAIRGARCDIVAVSDGGSILAPDWLERITAPLLRDDAVQVVGGGFVFQCDTRFEQMAAAAEIPVHRIPDDDFLPSSRSFAFRKTVWEAIGGYPETLTFAGEDTAFCLALRRAGVRIHLERGALVRWRPRPTLRKYIRQHVLYGIGDGEAGNKTATYSRIAGKYAGGGILLALSFFYPALLLAALGIIIAYGTRLHDIYEWSRLPARVWLPAFGLVSVKELTTTFGFVRGTMRRGTTGPGAA
jgi:glycosyltransferase involved in cell wall biosynthesis